MAEVKEIKINDIFSGQSASQYFGSKGTYNTSVAVDPDLPILSTDTRTSGFPVPVGYEKFSSTNVTGSVVAQITHPKDNLLWTIQANGKVVTYSSALTSASEIIIGTVTGSNASGAAYYNNYIYVFGTGASKNDVSRIGPLNTVPYDGQTGNFTIGLTVTGGTSGATGVITADVDAGATGTLTLSNISGKFTDNETITDTSTGSAVVNRTDASLIANGIWTGATLGSLTALTNTIYPSLRGVMIPNHHAHVHGDNSLYFCDFINGQGLIHRINTKKVTNEGDTNGTTVASAYNVLDLPFGFYPTAIESYQTNIIILGIYSTDATTNQGDSAFVIWDPTNTTSWNIGPVYLPDPLATAVKNINGLIHVWSGNAQNGVRVSRYLGSGESVKDLVYQEEGLPPFANAVDGLGNRVVWGGFTTNPSTGTAIFAYGSKDARIPSGLHHVVKGSGSGTNPIVTAVKFVQQSSNVTPKLILASTDGTGTQIDKYSTTATLASNIRFMFNLGQKGRILKIKIPLGGAVAANTTITPKLYFDDLSSNKSLTVINNTNYSGKRSVIYKGTELKDTAFYNNFLLEFAWTGTNPLPIALPITLTVELMDDEKTT